MSIGTAKPTKDELLRADHRFIDNISINNDNYNSHIYGIEGREVMEELLEDDKIFMVCGGSGLYVQALVEGFYEGVDIAEDIKLEFRKGLEKRSLDDLYSELQNIDSEYSLKVPHNNRNRIQRALEVYHLSGVKMSEIHKLHEKETYFKPLYIGLNTDREILYDRINRRVDIMVENGLIDEVKSLCDKYGYDTKRLNKTIGYTEIVRYLKGETELDFAISELKKNTRRFAKRQITWFKRLDGIEWFEPNNFDNIDKYIYEKVIKK